MFNVRWRILNSDRVEVSPESREHAWKDLLIDVLEQCPRYASYRTNVTRADFENFDYNRPIVYEIKNKTVLINSEFFNKALNKPLGAVVPMNVMSVHIFLAFICSLLLAIALAHTFPTPDDAESGVRADVAQEVVIKA
jgi:Per os infectivity factor 6